MSSKRSPSVHALSVAAAMAVVMVCLTSGCASISYQAYAEGPVQTGNGGQHEVVDGIDIWQRGTPPVPYRVVGMIDDERTASPLGAIGRLRAYAEQARRVGAQAVVIYSEGDVQPPSPGRNFGQASVFDNAYGAVPGNTGTPPSSAFGASFAKVRTRAAVVRYEEAGSVPPPSR